MDRKEEIGQNPGLAVIDFDQDPRERVITLGDEVIIDARDKLDKYNLVIDRVRKVFTTAMLYRDPDWQRYIKLAVVEVMRELGFSGTTEAKIKGKVPPHWDPSKIMNVTFVLGPPNVWKQKKQTLDQLADRLRARKPTS